MGEEVGRRHGSRRVVAAGGERWRAAVDGGAEEEGATREEEGAVWEEEEI